MDFSKIDWTAVAEDQIRHRHKEPQPTPGEIIADMESWATQFREDTGEWGPEEFVAGLRKKYGITK